MSKEFIKPSGVFEPRWYSHAVRAGNTIYVAGQVAYDKQKRLVPGGFEAQAVQALENLKQVLEQAGASLKDVVKMNTYMKDIKDLPQYREIRERYFPPPFPVHTTAQIVSLASPDLLIEIEAVAVID